MPGANRTLEEGMIHHVYNRVIGGEAPFSEDTPAARFLEELRKVAERVEALLPSGMAPVRHLFSAAG